MSFGPHSNNPRERRAYAHATIKSLKEGQVSYDVAFEAVRAARHTRKGEASGFVGALGNHALLLIDYTSYDSTSSSYAFSGTLFPPELARAIATYENSNDNTVVAPIFSWDDYPRANFTQDYNSEASHIGIDTKQVPAQVVNPASLGRAVMLQSS